MVNLSSPYIMRRLGIVLASDYAPSNDTLDCRAGITAAMIAAEGKTLVFDTPYGGSRTYRFTQRTTSAVQAIRRGKIVWDANALTDFTGWGTTGLGAGGVGVAFFRSDGVFAPAVAVDADIVPTSGPSGQTVTVASGAGFARGQRIVIQTTELFTPMNAPLGRIGEWATIAGVDGNVLTLRSAVRHTYAISGHTVTVHRAIDLCELEIENPRMVGPGLLDNFARGDRGFEITNADRVLITGGQIIDSDLYSLFAVNVRNFQVKDGVEFLKTQRQLVLPSPPNAPNTPDSRQRYHIGIAGVSEFALVQGCLFEGGTEQISPTITGGGNAVSPDAIEGLKNDIQIVNNDFRGAWRSAMSTHHAYLNLLMMGNAVDNCNQGFDMRLGGIAIGNRFTRMGGGEFGNLNTGIQVGSGFTRFYGSGNVFDDVARGYWLQSTTNNFRPTGDFISVGDVMTRVSQHGYRLDYNGGTGVSVDAALGRLSIQKAHIELAASGAPIGVQALGRWREPDIDVTVVGGSASARAVLLGRAPASTSAFGGPINPIIRDRRSPGILPPLVGVPANGAGSVSITSQVFGTP